ncbi:MAG: HAD family phosphatase [Dehalococcoidia bacterium]
MRSFQARAVIFDLDGVLVDSEPLSRKGLNQALTGGGASPITEEEFRRLIGTTAEETWNIIKEMRTLSHPLDYYLKLYDRVFPRILEEELVLQPGAMRVIDEVRARGLPLGLATSSRRRNVDVKLRLVGLNGTFDVIITGDEVQRPKPAPDIYLGVAQHLNVSPGECLAIEDSPRGVAAAVAAGMNTVGVRTPATAGMDISQANVIIDSLEEFDVDVLGGAARPGMET